MVLQKHNSGTLPSSSNMSNPAQGYNKYKDNNPAHGYNKYKDKFNRCKYNNKATTQYKARETVLDKLKKELTISPREGATSSDVDAEDIYSFNDDAGKNNSDEKTEEGEIILDLFKDNAGEEVFPDVQGSVDEGLDRKKDSPQSSFLTRQEQPLRCDWPNTNLIHRFGLYSGLSSSLYSLPDQLKFENPGERGSYAPQCPQGNPNGYLPLTPVHQEISPSSRSARPREMDDSSVEGSRTRQKSGPPIGDGNNDENYQLGKDEKLAREAGILIPIQDIIQLPMDEFNDMLARHDLTEDQLNMCRDIRRRGKNKVAAQNCRKRKIDQIEELQEKLDSAKQQKGALWQKHERMTLMKQQEGEKLDNLIRKILVCHNLSPAHYTIKVTDDDKVEIVARMCGQGQASTSLMPNAGGGNNDGAAKTVGIVEENLGFGASSQDLHSILAMEQEDYGRRDSQEICADKAAEGIHRALEGGRNQGPMEGGRIHGPMEEGRNHGTMSRENCNRSMEAKTSHGAINRGSRQQPNKY